MELYGEVPNKGINVQTFELNPFVIKKNMESAHYFLQISGWDPPIKAGKINRQVVLEKLKFIAGPLGIQ